MQISDELKLAELMNDNLRKTFEHLQSQSSSLLLLNLQWKDLQDHFDSTQKSIQERSQEIESIQESIKQRFEEITMKEKGFDAIQESIDRRFKELGSREEQFHSVEKLAIQERAKELDLIQKSIDERSNDFELFQRLIKEGFTEIELREKRIGLIQESIEERSVELESVQISIKERFEELEFKEKEFNSIKESIELKEKRFKECSKELALKEKQFEEGSKELELKEKLFEQRSQEFELKEKRFEERLKEKQLEKCSKELELKERGLDERSKELKTKEKEYTDIVHHQVNSEVSEKLQGNNAINSSLFANLRLCGTKNGKSLQLFLNEHLEEHGLMRDEVSAALRLSLDPAKLVLDAIQGFYPMHLENGNMSFEVSVVRRSCILLLEQLMKVSPEIKPHVKEEAMKLAFNWMTKMRPEAENYLEVLGFLLLLASYGLSHAFDEDELVSFLLIVAHHRRAPELCSSIGLGDEIPNLIHNLITRKQHLDAIRFIYACELVDKFPPVPLLKDYLYFSRNAWKIFSSRNRSLKAQNEANSKRIAELRAVIRCIEVHKLEGELSTIDLEICIAQLKQQIEKNTSTDRTPVPHAELQQRSGMKCTAPAVSTPAPDPAPVPIAAATPVPAPMAQPKQLSGNKHPRTAVSKKAVRNACVTVNSIKLHQQHPVGLYPDQDFIQNLIIKCRWLEAIRYIYAFGMVDKFPPVFLLKDYLSHTKMVAERLCEKENNSLQAQISANAKEFSALRAVISCIADHKLEPEYSTETLEKRCSQLEKQKADLLKVLNSKLEPDPLAESKSSICSTLVQLQREEKCIASPPVPPASNPTSSQTIAPIPSLAPKAKPQQRSRKKRRKTSASAEAAANDSIDNGTSNVHLKEQPHRKPAGLFAKHGAPYRSKSARRCRYRLESFPPVDQHMSSHAPNPTTHDYPMDALRQPGCFDRPAPFNGSRKMLREEPDYYDCPVSFGGHRDAL